MTGFIKDIFKKVIAAGYRLEGRKTMADGKPGGYFGPLLLSLDEHRLERILHKMSQTPMGCELVEYAQAKLKSLDMSYKWDGSGARYVTDLTVGLESRKSDSFLIGALAHELRHAYQHEMIGRLFRTYALPPEAALVITRFVEADAYRFQQKFCEDYADRTGDRGPLNDFLKVVKDKTLREGLELVKDDAGRFLIWAETLVNGAYDGSNIANLLQSEEERRQAGPEKEMISPDVSKKLILAVARQIDTDWPQRIETGVRAHYLSGLTDEQLLNRTLTRMPNYSGMEALKKNYAADYARKHDNKKGALKNPNAPP